MQKFQHQPFLEKTLTMLVLGAIFADAQLKSGDILVVTSWC